MGNIKIKTSSKILSIVKDFRMEEATKNFVSVAVGGGPDDPAGLDSEQVEVAVHDKPRFLRERPKLVHRITKEDLWGAKERLRKISIDTLDSVFAGFEMPQATSQYVCFHFMHAYL